MGRHSGGNPNSEDVARPSENPNAGDPARYGRPSRVVGIGAACDFAIGTPESGPAQSSSVKEFQSFSVKEFVALEDGRRVVVDGSTFTLNLVTELIAPARAVMTPDSIRKNVLVNLLLDDDYERPEDDSSWQYLAEQVREQGTEVTADELKGLPYEVVLTGELVRWLLTR